MLSKSAEKGEKRFSADARTPRSGHRRSVRSLHGTERVPRPSTEEEAQSEFNKSVAKFRHEIPVGLIRRTRGRTGGRGRGRRGMPVAAAAAFKPFSPALKLMGERTERRTAIDEGRFFPDAKNASTSMGK